MNDAITFALDHRDPFSMAFLQKKLLAGHTVLVRRNSNDTLRRVIKIRRAMGRGYSGSAGSTIEFFVPGYYSISWELDVVVGWTGGITLTLSECERVSIKKGLDAEGKEALILCLNLQSA